MRYSSSYLGYSLDGARLSVAAATLPVMNSRGRSSDATDAEGKPEGVGTEFADVFIRLLDYCARFDVDLEAEYERKMAYNHTRPYRHGNRRS